ncbi:MAG: hypothetical protein D6744_03760 [Planctomycetota bacterium]|nr:MAG: hypothetical protein D6744_03760 [Planctomycetota bacterium]
MSSPAKNSLGILCLLAVLALAVWRLSASGAEPLPDTPESRTAWICTACGRLTELTARQRADWARTPGKVRTGGTEGVVMAGAAQTVFRCDVCDAFTIVRARQCSRHGVWYAVKDAAGHFVGCAACNAEGG